MKRVIDRDEKDRTSLSWQEISAHGDAQSKKGKEVVNVWRPMWGLGRKDSRECPRAQDKSRSWLGKTEGVGAR